MIKKTFLSIFIILIFTLMTSIHAEAMTVFANFDGDTNATFDFAGITSTHLTGTPGTGLADFTGSAFGLTTVAQETALELAILGMIQTDYTPYDVTFDTSQPAGTFGTDWVYWGIDDTGYTYRDDPGPAEWQVLFGKVDALNGNYARTWAGSFSLDGATNPYGGPYTSNPELDISTHTIAQIAQALANNAAHEIAHLFGVLHEGTDAGLSDVPWNLMQTDFEGVMANTDKYFSTQTNTQLLASLGSRPCDGPDCIIDPPCTDNCPVGVPEPSTMLLLGSGLIGLAYSRRKLKK